MLFGDDALYYQIVRDAHDPDPAVILRHRPFTQTPAPFASELDPQVRASTLMPRLDAGLRAVARRLRPQPAISPICCAPAGC